jgi:hypothetical protein
MKKLFCLILLLLLVSISYNSCGLFEPSEYLGYLKGTVRDSTTHDNLFYVTVNTIPPTHDTLTDSSGNFMIKNIPMSNSDGYVTLVASRIGYLNDTIIAKIKSDDTTHVTFALFPWNSILIANGIILNQFTNSFSLSAVNLINLKVERDFWYDVDVKYRNTTNLIYLKTGYDGSTYDGFETKFSPPLGKLTKYQFDTLQKFYAASNPIDPINDFPYNITQETLPENVKNDVYAFFLKGRFSPGNSFRAYGLLHIDSVWNNISLGLSKIMFDVKINKVGMNYFIR